MREKSEQRNSFTSRCVRAIAVLTLYAIAVHGFYVQKELDSQRAAIEDLQANQTSIAYRVLTSQK